MQISLYTRYFRGNFWPFLSTSIIVMAMTYAVLEAVIAMEITFKKGSLKTSCPSYWKLQWAVPRSLTPTIWCLDTPCTGGATTIIAAAPSSTATTTTCHDIFHLHSAQLALNIGQTNSSWFHI